MFFHWLAFVLLVFCFDLLWFAMFLNWLSKKSATEESLFVTGLAWFFLFELKYDNRLLPSPFDKFDPTSVFWRLKFTDMSVTQGRLPFLFDVVSLFFLVKYDFISCCLPHNSGINIEHEFGMTADCLKPTDKVHSTGQWSEPIMSGRILQVWKAFPAKSWVDKM